MRYSKSIFIAMMLISFSEVKGDIIEISPLSFGSIVITDNTTQEKVVLNYSGNVGYSSGIYAVTPPNAAEFLLTNYPSNQQVFISARSTQARSNSDIYSADQFTLTNVDVPSVLTTDNSGSAALFVGGTLETSGSGVNSYLNTQYRISYQISVNY